MKLTTQCPGIEHCPGKESCPVVNMYRVKEFTDEYIELELTKPGTFPDGCECRNEKTN